MRVLPALFFVASVAFACLVFAIGAAEARETKKTLGFLEIVTKSETHELSRAEKRRIRRAQARKRRKYRNRTYKARSYRKSRKQIRREQRARRAKARARARENARRADLYKRQVVRYRTEQKPGTIIVDTGTRHLYYTLRGGKAIRYGVAVGKEGFAWKGTSRIRRKVKWPTWTPPKEMIERKPELAKYADGQPGGPDNPLGARALYLFQGKKDTLYRIHGTNAPWSIGRAASSGCIRMLNQDVTHLYALVRNGTKVIVR